MFQVKNFSFSYPNSSKKSLDNINLSLNKGEVVLVVGPNGGGKTSLLKSLMGIIPSMTGGDCEGSMEYLKKPVFSYSVSRLAGEVGFALQDPENQITNLTVWEEVIFGPSNLKWSPEKIIKESTNALVTVNLKDVQEKPVLSLSAGQLQRLSIASLISMNPSVLILDEPVSNLDPHGVFAVTKALEAIKKTADLVVISTHLIDPFLDIANRVVIIDEGKVAADISMNNLHEHLDVLKKHKIEIPQKYSIIEKLEKAGIKNLNLKNINKIPGIKINVNLNKENKQNKNYLLDISGIYYSYEKNKQILENISLKIGFSEQIVLAGKNGEGKTTLARIISGLIKPSLGKVIKPKIKIALLMQKSTLGFIGDTVLEEVVYGGDIDKADGIRWLEKFNIKQFGSTSPFRISGGEQRRLALAAAFARNPDLLILDEPTVGLDSFQVRQLIENLNSFKGAVLYISHDIRMVENCSRLVVLGERTIKYDGHRSKITPWLANYLGFPLVNFSTELALLLKSNKIPLSPEEIGIYK